MKRAILLAVLWLGLSLSLPLQAATADLLKTCLAQGQTWEAQKQYEKAREAYEKAAVLGSALACQRVAYFYDLGCGVEVDKREALRWYKKAAKLSPEDRALKGHIAALELTLILTSSNPSPQEVATFRASFRRQLLFGFAASFVVYVVATGLLLFLSWKGPSGLLVASGWAVLFIGAQLVALLALIALPLPLSAAYLLVITGAMSAGPLIVASLLAPVRARFWTKLDCGWKTVLACLGLAFGVGLFLAHYDTIYQLITRTSLPVQPTLPMIGDLKATSAILTYGIVAVVMPMAEEILFRGFLFEGIRRWLSPVVAVLYSSLAFALLHFQMDYFIPLLIFGLMLGYVRLKTKSLRLTFFLHSFNNALSVAMV